MFKGIRVILFLFEAGGEKVFRKLFRLVGLLFVVVVVVVVVVAVVVVLVDGVLTKETVVRPVGFF